MECIKDGGAGGERNLFSHTMDVAQQNGCEIQSEPQHVFQFSREFPLPNCRFNPFFCVAPKAIEIYEMSYLQEENARIYRIPLRCRISNLFPAK